MYEMPLVLELLENAGLINGSHINVRRVLRLSTGQLSDLGAERRYRLLDDLRVMVRIRPLIETGLIIPVTTTGEVGHQCIALGAFGTDADKRFIHERQRLARRFFEKMSVDLGYDDGEWEIRGEAPEQLLEHGGTIIPYREPPEPL